MKYKNIHSWPFFKILGRTGFYWGLIGFLASISLGLVEYFFALFLQLFINKAGLLDEGDIPKFFRPFLEFELNIVLVMMVLAGIFKACAHLFQGRSSVFTQEIVNLKLRYLALSSVLYSKTKSLGMATHEIYHYYSEIFPKSAGVVSVAVNLASGMIQVFILLTGMVALAPLETAVTICSLAIIGAISLTLSRIVKDVGTEIPKNQASISQDLHEISKNRLFIEISGIQDQEYQKSVNRNLQLNHFIAKNQFFVNLSNVTPSALGIASVVLTIYLSQTYFGTSANTLLAFLYLNIRLGQQVGNCSGFLTSLYSTYPAFKILLSLIQRVENDQLNFISEPVKLVKKLPLGTPPNWTVKKPVMAKPTQIKPMAPELKIINISYDYPGSQLHLINNFSFRIPKGSSVALVGRSGSGKSTLLKLILGILTPNSGSIQLGGLLPKDFVTQHSRYIGYVGPEPYLIDATIRENLGYGNKSYLTDGDAWEALALASIDKEIRQLPGGLDAVIDNHSNDLSTGQKQRLSLARALAKKPCLLILDEASANLDMETEIKIAETLESVPYEVTKIIVSHRMGIIKHCNYNINLDTYNRGSAELEPSYSLWQAEPRPN